MQQDLRLRKLSSVPVNSLAQVRVDQSSLGVSFSGTIASLGCTARLFGVISKAQDMRCVSCGGHVHTGLFHCSSGGGGAVVSALVAYTRGGSIGLIAGCICAGRALCGDSSLGSVSSSGETVGDGISVVGRGVRETVGAHIARSRAQLCRRHRLKKIVQRRKKEKS